MNDIEILEKMIENEGECMSFANDEICKKCPMSKLKKREDGYYYSCLEAVGASVADLLLSSDDLEAEQITKSINDKYLVSAKKVLADLNVQKMLED